MPFELSINSDLKLVHLVYSGDVVFKERKLARDDVFKACEEHNLSRALVDMSRSNIRMNESDVVRFASEFQKAILPPNYRLACVVSAHNQTENLVQIIISQEGINIRYFSSEAEAMKWLLAVQV